MSISAKLAKDFVKRNFGAFKFDTYVNWNRMTTYDVQKAYVIVDGTEIHLFELKTSSTGYMMMSLPKCLNSNEASLDEMIRKIEHDNLDMSSYLDNSNVLVRVTTNRLLVLEKLMLRSGVLYQTLGFSTKQQAQLNERISELQKTAQQNYNNLILQLNSMMAMVNS